MLNINNQNIEVVILCGGKGERLRPITNDIPKPLLEIKEKPILSYIIDHLSIYNFHNFIFATGYMSDKISSYVKDSSTDYSYKIVDSGEADIIERIQAASEYIKNDFLLLYGDTISDVNINELINYHSSKDIPVTMTVWPLKSQFGLVNINKVGEVLSFQEKPILDKWINIGYFYIKYEILEIIKNYKRFDLFLVDIASKKMLNAYRHMGKHITVNTLEELRKAEQNIDKIFIMEEYDV